MATARVALLGFYHETNTFAAVQTAIADFHAYQTATGGDVLTKYAGTGTELGGIIAEAERAGVELAPVMFAAAVPSGLISSACFETIATGMIDGLDGIGAYDGILAVLHGAAAADGAPDADGTLLKALREKAGPDRPIVATADFHANLSQAMVGAADAIVGYDTYPHTDMAERGAEAVRLMDACLRGMRPATAFRKLPLVTVPQCQSTEDEPMRTIMARVHEAEARDGILCITLAMGFPFADTPDLGAGILVHARHSSLAEEVASEIADLVWEAREAFAPALLPLDAVAGLVGDNAATPVVLVDPADNVGGGSAGDGTAILAELLGAKAHGAVIVICDPAAARKAAEAGIGATITAPVGGHTDDLHGDPVPVTGTVTFADNARFTHSGTYMTGFVTDMGLTAIVDAGGVRIVLTSLRTMPFDIEHLRCVGIEPSRQRVIVAKSAIGWRAAFADAARSAFTIDTPGICPSNLKRLAYRNRPVPMYPLESDTRFPGARRQ